MAIYIKVETTGTNISTAEILRVCIVNDYGKTLFDEYVRPVHTSEWSIAARFNGITPEMVANARTFEELREDIQNIFDNTKMVIGYNSGFEMRFLRENGIKYTGSVQSVMEKFAPIYGDWNVKQGKFRFARFENCVNYYNANPKNQPLTDGLVKARATMECWKYLKNELKG